MNLGKQEVRKCPCGDPICHKAVVWPLFGRPDASVGWETAEEIVRRLNAAETSEEK